MAAPPFPTSTSSLLLPTASQNLSSTLSALKRSTLSTSNRLRSIHHDSTFVQDVARSYNLPLIPNERCGSWYIPPERKAGSAYFKSTDGHWGQWSFSTRRLNLHILDIIGRHGGCIVVDSTRRGKSMPDALSKTIPIWCAVINRLLFEEFADSHSVHTPEEIVSESEHAHIEACIGGFVAEAKSLNIDIAPLRSALRKPLRPSWITPDQRASDHLLPSSEYHRVICCTASHRVVGAEITENGYIQGAGDDSEGWSHGLTPPVFWENKEQLLGAVEENIADVIYQMIEFDRHYVPGHDSAVKIGSTNFYIGRLADATQLDSSYDGIVICTQKPPHIPDSKDRGVEQKRILHFPCNEGKLGSRALRSHLPRLRPFLASLPSHAEPPKLLFACSTGNDLCVGVALTALCMLFDDEYSYNFELGDKSIDKALIRRRLAYISSAKPDANPSRSTLQSVNAFLMPRNG